MGMDDGGRDPELAAYVVIMLHWTQASDETRDSEGAELPDDGPGDDLLDREFLRLNGAVYEELRFAQKASMYKIAIGDTLFNALFNDRELYTFIGSLYLARHFADPVNRSAFLSSNQEFTEKQLLKLVGRCNIHDAKGMLSPRLAKLTNRVLETMYITYQPAKYILENEHLSPVLQMLRERQRVLAAVTDEDKAFHAAVVVKHFRRMEKHIVKLYKLAQLGPRRHSSDYERCREEQAFTLTQEEAERLLAAARVNGFFHDLISSRPPEAGSISHEQALFECAEHARLWLFNSRLRVYYNFSFTYDDIGKAPPSSEELEAWNSPVGYKVRLPSFDEKHVRRKALAGHWDELEYPPEERDDSVCKVPEYNMLRIRNHDLMEKVQALDAFLAKEKLQQLKSVADVPEPLLTSGEKQIAPETSGPAADQQQLVTKRKRVRAVDNHSATEEPSSRKKQKRKRERSGDVSISAAAAPAPAEESVLELNGGRTKAERKPHKIDKVASPSLVASKGSNGHVLGHV